ncbi:MAG: hypothetical protein R6V49_05170 [Bacteroidales bacterium]
MTERKTSKKLTRVSTEGTGSSTPATPREPFVASRESKAKARNLRLLAVLAWVIALGLQIGAIIILRKAPVNMTWLIILIVADLIFAIAGNILWKKSNRLDPASVKEKTKFFIQNQLGTIISIIVFLPLVILIFTNKNLSGKQKGLVGTIAVAAMLIAGITGVDLNPPSQEEYQEQTEQVESLNDGVDLVYWTKSGKSYHLYQDCSYINTDRTDEIFEGTVAQAREMKNITDLCDRCERRALKAQEEQQQIPEETAE